MRARSQYTRRQRILAGIFAILIINYAGEEASLTCSARGTGSSL